VNVPSVPTFPVLSVPTFPVLSVPTFPVPTFPHVSRSKSQSIHSTHCSCRRARRMTTVYSPRCHSCSSPVLVKSRF